MNDLTKELLKALKRAKDSLVAFKFVPGDANRWEESDEENLAAVNSAIAAADARQERLLKKLVAWFARRAQEARAKRYDEGFKWAAAELLSGRDVDYVERDIDNGRDMGGEKDPFDLGAKAACLAWPIREHRKNY